VTRLVSLQRFVLVRVAGVTRHQIDTTFCQWCTDDGVCSHHAALADKARRSIARSDARKGARS